MNVMTDDYKCQVRISGIEETPDNTASKQIIEDQVQIEEVLEKIDCSFPIKGVRRMGRYYPGRKRKVLITFQSPWEARLVIAKAIENNLFQEHKVLITPGLSKEDALREKTLLQKRYEMIQNGTDPKTLKIRILKLYQNGNEVQIEWLTKFEEKIPKILYLNVQGLLSFQKRIDLQKLYLTGSYDMMLLSET